MKKVVIADDSGMARVFIKRAMEIVMVEPTEYIEAIDGQDALDKMKATTPDLLITDLNMPNMDGAQLLRRIIASPKLHGTPSIVITSLLNPAKEMELKNYGVSAILGKPLDPVALAAAVNTIFNTEDDNGNGW